MEVLVEVQAASGPVEAAAATAAERHHDHQQHKPQQMQYCVWQQGSVKQH